MSEGQRIGSIIYILKDFIFNSNFIQMIIGHGYLASCDKMLQVVIVIENFSTTDNQFLTILYDYGLVGLLITIGFIVKNLIHVLKNKNMDMFYIHLALLGFWVNSFFYESLRWSNVFTIALFLIGVLIYSNENIKHQAIKDSLKSALNVRIENNEE